MLNIVMHGDSQGFDPIFVILIHTHPGTKQQRDTQDGSTTPFFAPMSPADALIPKLQTLPIKVQIISALYLFLLTPKQLPFKLDPVQMFLPVS